MKYKSTIIIYSEFDPQQMELADLAYEADQGAAICDSMNVTMELDSNLPEGVSEFFNLNMEFDNDTN